MAIQNNKSILSRTTRNSKAAAEVNPLDGCWVNVGVVVELPDGEGGTIAQMVRLPMGIPATALKKVKIYDNMSDEYKARQQTLNSVIDALTAKFDELEAGDSAPVAMSVELYRRQEESEEVAAPAETQSSIADQLFNI